MTDVYDKLRARLDDMATGFPETESKIEIKLLKRLFTEAEADLFLQLMPTLQKPEDVAERLQRDPAEISDMMEQMAKKGLLFRKRDGDRVRYAAVPYVVGIYEFQLNAMDEAFAHDHEEYFETAFGSSIQEFKTPMLRTVPINRGLVADWPVAPYEDVLEIIDNQKKIAVTPCICRTKTKLIGKDCDKPLDNCFSFVSQCRDLFIEL